MDPARVAPIQYPEYGGIAESLSPPIILSGETMTRITRRAFGALGFAGVAAHAYAKAPAIKSAWPDATETASMI